MGDRTRNGAVSRSRRRAIPAVPPIKGTRTCFPTLPSSPPPSPRRASSRTALAPHVEYDAVNPANRLGGSVARIFGADDKRSQVTERVLVTRPGRADALALIETVSTN
jgi:hypothetical protein